MDNTLVLPGKSSASTRPSGSAPRRAASRPASSSTTASSRSTSAAASRSSRPRRSTPRTSPASRSSSTTRTASTSAATRRVARRRSRGAPRTCASATTPARHLHHHVVDERLGDRDASTGTKRYRIESVKGPRYDVKPFTSSTTRGRPARTRRLRRHRGRAGLPGRGDADLLPARRGEDREVPHDVRPENEVAAAVPDPSRHRRPRRHRGLAQPVAPWWWPVRAACEARLGGRACSPSLIDSSLCILVVHRNPLCGNGFRGCGRQGLCPGWRLEFRS